MSEFGTFLENQRESQGLSAKEMASRLGLAQSALSHLTTEARRGVRPASLAKIVTGISEDPEIQAAALQACFRDQCIPKYRDWVRIVPGNDPSGSRISEDPAPLDTVAEHAAALRTLRLPNTVIRALTAIARAVPGRQKFRIVIEDLGEFASKDLLNREEEAPE